MTPPRKVRKAVGLDADLVEIPGDEANLSDAVHAALRRETDRTRRTVARGEWPVELASERGALDETEVAAAVGRGDAMVTNGDADDVESLAADASVTCIPLA